LKSSYHHQWTSQLELHAVDQSFRVSLKLFTINT
jgi:hypothetical protein